MYYIYKGNVEYYSEYKSYTQYLARILNIGTIYFIKKMNNSDFEIFDDNFKHMVYLHKELLPKYFESVIEKRKRIINEIII